MVNREVIVRIIQPSEQPLSTERKVVPSPLKKEKNLFQAVINGVGLVAIAALALFFVIGFFNLGFAVKEVIILVGIPLFVGMVARYVIF